MTAAATETMFRLHCSQDLSEPPPAETVERLRRVARLTLARHPVGGGVDAVLTDDDEVRRLNHTYRGRDAATDVLSFSFRQDPTSGTAVDVVVADPARGPVGEVYISIDRARHQAKGLGVGCDEELARLLVHGLLHLAGYDHQTEAELAFMEGETDALLGADRG